MVKGIWKLGLLVVFTLLLSACGNSRGGEKIAVINWQKAMEQHPLQAKLKLEEKQLKLLVDKRKQQEKLALAQLSSLNKLTGLKDISQRSYLSADFNTYMAARQAVEQGKLISFSKQVEQEADAVVAERKKQVEDTYQLEMFNLKLKLEAVKLTPEQRQSIELKLEAAKLKRDKEMFLVEAEKQAYMQTKLQPYVEEMRQRLQEAAQKKNQENLAQLDSSQEKYTKLMEAAPKALQNALAIMDRKIDKQQAKCDSLRKQLGKDIESQVIRLTKERGYTIVFSKYQVNVKAEDITQQVVDALKKQN